MPQRIPASRFFSFLLSFFACSCFFYFQVPIARAATSTVCATGCDFTTITDAFAGIISGTTLSIGANYTSSTETFPLIFPTNNITLDCQNSGALIGVPNASSSATITLTNQTTIRNCQFNNVVLSNSSSGASINILDNIFTTSATSSIYLASLPPLPRGSTFNISGNRNIGKVTISGWDVGTISNNTWHSTTLTLGDLSIDQADSIVITNNTIENFTAPSDSSGNLVNIDLSTDITFTTNTVRSYPNNGSLLMSNGSSMIVQGNDFFMATNTNFLPYPTGINFSSASGPLTVDLKHNTFQMPGECRNCVALQIEDTPPGNSYAFDLNVTSTYNLFTTIGSYGSVTNTKGYYFLQDIPTSTMNIYSDFNGDYGFQDRTVGTYNFQFGTHTLASTKPIFKTMDADPSNDLELAPWSVYLDVNGTEDIGAHAGTRGNSFILNAGGTVDYSTVHATSSNELIPYIHAGDTVTIRPGIYDAFTLSNVTSVTLTGAAPGVIFRPTTSTENVITLNGVSSSTINNLTLEAASSSGLNYSITRQIYSYNGHDYNDSDSIGFPANDAIIFSPTGGACNAQNLHIDDQDVTSLVGNATNDWHLALLHVTRLDNIIRITALVPNNVYPTAQALETDCIGDGPVFVDAWVTSTYAVNNGFFTYNKNAVEAAGISLLHGYIQPPRLDRVSYSGISFKTSENNLISNVTSTENGYGLWFRSDSSNNTIQNSTFTHNMYYDIYSTTNDDNVLKNVSFLTSSSSVLGNGNINVFFTARGFVQSSSSAPLANIPVTFQDAGHTTSTTYLTNGSGYTPSTGYLPAMTFTSSSITLTSGGYNPYTLAVANDGVYGASSTSANLTIPNQLFALTLLDLTIPTAPSGATAQALSATSVNLSWTDNGSGAGAEDSFLINYINDSAGQAWPGTTTTVAQNTTSTIITGLSPNTRYFFRVAGKNVIGTSSYSTTTVLTTPSNTSPVAIVNGGGGGGGGSAYIPINPTYQTYTYGTSTNIIPLPIEIIPEQNPSSPSNKNISTLPETTTIQYAGSLTEYLGISRNQKNEALTLAQAQADIKGSNLKATPAQMYAMANFIAYGTSQTTMTLGQGERRALLRDYLETVGRTAVVWSDVERLAAGQIPTGRNIPLEQKQITKNLPIFQALFSVKTPNFKDSKQNLAWNILMYRIRIPRDLKKEAAGIKTFQQAFKRLPKTPLDWATVRVAGYVK